MEGALQAVEDANRPRRNLDTKIDTIGINAFSLGQDALPLIRCKVALHQ